jgi:hypothetical protein
MGAKSISRVDAAVLQEAVDREPFQQIEAIASRSQSPTSATKSALSVAFDVRFFGRYRGLSRHRHSGHQVRF